MSKSEGLYPTVPEEEQGHVIVPPGYTPAHQQGIATVVVSTPVAPIVFGPVPQLVTCPHCHQHITSNIKVETTMKTHVIALVLCMLCCIPCCLIPYCMDSCQNRNHYCPSCNAYLGNYQ